MQTKEQTTSLYPTDEATLDDEFQKIAEHIAGITKDLEGIARQQQVFLSWLKNESTC